ncbi:9052_t:CDS:2 [Entrophospora sp. SA101]|nr:9052_t:CDS:2 [Entrophospora sp. SA101]
MTKMTVNEFSEFDKKLNELLERKPPGTSASKIKDLTKIALNSPKQYKNIVHSIQKFIQRCPSDYKLGALYVLDSISQTAQKQKGPAKTKNSEDISSITSTTSSSSSSWTGAEYLDRFEKLLEETFTHIMQCPEHDKDKVKRVLDLWYDKETYNKETIQRIKDTHFNQTTSLTQLVNEIKSVNVSSSNNDPNNMNPTTMDSSTLLATLNNLAQGTLNIPPFLSSNPTPNVTIPYNNLPVNSSQLPHSHLHAIPPHQIQQQPLITSYATNIAPLSTNPSLANINNNYLFAMEQQPNGPFVPPPGYSAPSMIPGHPLIPSITHQLVSKLAHNVQTSSSPPAAVTSATATNITGSAGTDPSQQQPGQISAPIQPIPQISAVIPVTTAAPVTQPIVHQSSLSSSPLPQQQQTQIPQDICLVYEDPTVGMEYIKVLSRTLYVGSVSEEMPKDVMQEMFIQFGPVSTVTINYEKNHAFIKMDTRAGAARALSNIRTKMKIRWALGFGPKDCFDYRNGESLIPISKLTETDKKWLITSKQGGTGRRPIVGGVVVEEPDIVIGEGLSCGSINKKIGGPERRERDD